MRLLFAVFAVLLACSFTVSLAAPVNVQLKSFTNRTHHEERKYHGQGNVKPGNDRVLKEQAPQEQKHHEAKEQEAPSEQRHHEAKEQEAPSEQKHHEAKEQEAPSEQGHHDAKEQEAPQEHSSAVGETIGDVVGELAFFWNLRECRKELGEMCIKAAYHSFEEWWTCISNNVNSMQTRACRAYVKGMLACKKAADNLCGKVKGPHSVFKCLSFLADVPISLECTESRFFKEGQRLFFERQKPIDRRRRVQPAEGRVKLGNRRK